MNEHEHEHMCGVLCANYDNKQTKYHVNRKWGSKKNATKLRRSLDIQLTLENLKLLEILAGSSIAYSEITTNIQKNFCPFVFSADARTNINVHYAMRITYSFTHFI